MYEDQTYDIILERMMNRVSDKIDKRPSSPVYDLHSSTAIEFQILYIELEYLIKNSYGDTAAREFLILLAKDRGLSPEPATKAILQGEFTPTNIDVTGKRFNIGEINYVVTEQITPGTYKVQCETEGVVGNQYLGDMIPMEYIDGLQTAKGMAIFMKKSVQWITCILRFNTQRKAKDGTRKFSRLRKDHTTIWRVCNGCFKTIYTKLRNMPLLRKRTARRNGKYTNFHSSLTELHNGRFYR